MSDVVVGNCHKSVAASLLCNLKKVKSSRYEASRRLKTQHGDTTYLIVVLSIGVLCFSLVPYYYPNAGSERLKLLSFVSAVFSVFILAFSLMQDSKQRLVGSELFQRCATELLDLRNRIKYRVQSREFSEGDMPSFIKEYTDILSKYPINHEDVDYAKTRLEMWSSIEGPEKHELKRLFVQVYYYSFVHYIKFFYLLALTTVVWLIVFAVTS